MPTTAATKPADVTTTREVSGDAIPAAMRPIGEVHKELIAEAEKQGQFNADQHALQVEQNNKFQNLANNQPFLQPPDDARADALDAQVAETADPAKPAKPAAPANQAQGQQK